MERRAATLLRQWAGLALPDHRWPLLRAALEGMAPDGTAQGGLDRIEAGDRLAKQRLLAGITVPETYLFRHPSHFEALAEHALAAAAAGRLSPYRVLSAGCATGEEAWSAAAVLDKVGQTTGLRWEVIGWDLDADRIARARLGEYSAWSARSGLCGHEDAFEPRARGGWAVHPRLRGPVSFQCVNLKLGPAPDTEPFDVVFLRNVAIYWAPECVAEMTGRIAKLVAGGGMLLLGASEPESLNRAEWSVEWRDSVRVATRQSVEVSAPARVGSAPGEFAEATIEHERVRSRAAFVVDGKPEPSTVALAVDRESEPSTVALAVDPEPEPSTAMPVCADPLERVRELADRGQYLEALAILESLTPAPEAELYLWRGILCLNLARSDEALSCVRKAVFLAPFDLACRHWLAVALMACGQHEAAAREQRNLREIGG